MEKIKPKGTIKIYEGKKEKLVNTFYNDFMDIGRKKLVNVLMGNSENLGYSFLAIGDLSGEVTAIDTSLSNEVFRKEITIINTVDNKLIIDTFFDTFEANFEWKEVGLFVGGELSLKDTGLLFHKAGIDQNKNSGKSLTISWEVEII